MGGAAGAVGLALSAVVLGPLFRATYSEGLVAFAIPSVLVIALLLGSRLARHEVAGPLALALGGTVGCALYYFRRNPRHGRRRRH